MRGSAVAAPAPEPEPEVAATEDVLPPGTMVGEYRIETRLGKGGMGAVYGARHPVIGKRVAIR
jgi:serine/threonine-protein kinase